MIGEVDAGPIIDVIEEALPPGITHSELRALTQEASLRMLGRTACLIDDAAGLVDVREALNRNAARQHATWGECYTSRQQLKTVLSDLRTRDPGHRAFL